MWRWLISDHGLVSLLISNHCFHETDPEKFPNWLKAEREIWVPVSALSQCWWVNAVSILETTESSGEDAIQGDVLALGITFKRVQF